MQPAQLYLAALVGKEDILCLCRLSCHPNPLSIPGGVKGVIMCGESGIEEHGGEMGKRLMISLFTSLYIFPIVWTNAWEREIFLIG